MDMSGEEQDPSCRENCDSSRGPKGREGCESTIILYSWKPTGQCGQDRAQCVLRARVRCTSEDGRIAPSEHCWTWDFLSPLFCPPGQSGPDQHRRGRECGYLRIRKLQYVTLENSKVEETA
ncbi:hypothetical protein E5288_WYG012574 [Bos mutus]|uniref:Uncharacterized protein n=1 Tax=Bos mutus TaxID=72004 RepID=A0A6B0RZJ0_9CETA|nr:hypothetical protein [Bos mutus]